MRILMLDNEFPPKGGGMGTVNKALLEQFAADRELEIDLVTSSLENEYAKRRFSERIRIFEVPVGAGNIHHASNPELVRYGAQAYQTAVRLLSERAYDFCFAWSAVPAGAVAFRLRRRLPFMTWVSGPDIPGFERRYDYLFPVLKPLLRRIWRESQPLIAKCREEVELIRAVEPEVPVEVIPNGVDTAKFRPGDRIPDEGALRVVCAARLIERKGQRQLIRAARILKDRGVDIRVVLLGDGDARRPYQDLAGELGVADRIEFAGFVAPEQIPERLAEAHIFVLPSYFEGMSLATLEAMAAGLPVIATRTGVTGDLVVDGVNGFTFEWGDVDMLAAHLGRLAGDRELARAMGAASRGRAVAYAWPEIGRLYRAVFERVLAGTAAAA